MVVPILQRKKLRLREGKRLTQGHTAGIQACPTLIPATRAPSPLSPGELGDLRGGGQIEGGMTAERKLTVSEDSMVIVTLL